MLPASIARLRQRIRPEKLESATHLAPEHPLGRRTPCGWFAVATSQELAPGQLSERVLASNRVVVYRTASGQAAVADARCPHLGASFAHGGQVEGEALRCGFHGFTFSPQGHCLSTGYGTAPPVKARLSTWPVQEVNGFIFAWVDPTGGPPRWTIPEVDATGFSPLATHLFSLAGHPQETTENSVDCGHFGHVHDYDRVESIRPLRTEGPYLTTSYGFGRRWNFWGLRNIVVRTEIDIHAYGFGYSHVATELLGAGLSFHQFILATPTNPGRIDLRIGIRASMQGRRSKAHPLLSLLPRRLMLPTINRLSLMFFQHDISQDFDIWSNKGYIEKPPLARGDGPIGTYRRWARQFYNDSGMALAIEDPPSD